MNTEEKLLMLLESKDEVSRELYKLYYIDCLSIRQIIEKNIGMNKYTFAKYLYLNIQIPKILIHVFSGYFDDVTDIDVFKKMILNVIDKSYTMARSQFRIGTTTTKIKRVFTLWIDSGLPMDELRVFLGFILFIKNHGTCLHVNRDICDNYLTDNTNVDIGYNNYLMLLDKWIKAGILKEIKTSTKSKRFIIKDYSSAKYNALPYFIKLLEYCLLNDNVYFHKLLGSFLYGIKMRIVFLYVCNVITNDDIYEILFKSIGDYDSMFKSIIFEKVRMAVDDPDVNDFVKYKFKKIFKSKKKIN